MVSKLPLLVAAPLALLLTPPARGQSINEIVRVGDTITGIGNVSALNGLGVDDAGNVAVHVFTDHPDADANAGLVDNDAVPIVWEGAAVNAPPGAVVQSFNGGEFTLNASGRPVFNIVMLGTSGPGDNDGIYHGVPLEKGIQESDLVNLPGVPAGSVWYWALTAKINAAGDLCFHSGIDDPAIAGAPDLGAIIVLDKATGTLSAPYRTGDVLPGQTADIKEFERDMHGLSFNDAGQIFFGALLTSGERVLYIGDTKVAQTGEISPFGSTYASVATATLGVALNNTGDHAFSCKLGNSEDGIVRNGEPFVQTGATLPSISPFNLNELGQPLFVGDDGKVVWNGLWEKPGGQGKGLFVDYNLVVEEKVTEVGGVVIDGVSGLDRSLTISPSGQYLLFKATLAGGVDGAFLIDLWE